jgi:hypothetical protein
MKLRQHLLLIINSIRLQGFLILLFSFIIQICFAQEKADSVNHPEWMEKVNGNKQVQKIIKGISRKPETFHEKSETPFLPYNGKIIRKIEVQQLGFERTVLDTVRNLRNFITKSANKLHTDTREFVTRNYLFVKEGKPLNPYRVADNERALRNLDFIMDARIYVKPISEESDSVDLLVVTRDVFSFGASFNSTFPSRYNLSIRDLNVGGTGQRMQIGQTIDTDRNPNYGYEGSYRLNNMAGTFIDGSVGYTTLNNGISLGRENEQSLYVKLSRSLYQPFARWAGEIEFSDNSSRNFYNEPDSVFAEYRYQTQDYWVGYSFGHNYVRKNGKENRNRKFIAVRAYDQHFLRASNTDLTELDRYAYRDRFTALAQLTFFRQDFYRTQFVYGFGRTEDIPYGYRLSVTAGWEKELGNKRPYVGGELIYNHVRHTGTLLSYDFKLASYWKENGSQDGLFSVSYARYSKMYTMGKFIGRHRTETSYALLFNQQLKQGITINDINGILGFKPDSLMGKQRVTLSQEETIFTPWKVLGFRSALVARVDLGLLQENQALLRSENFYSGFSLGLRARNENLIFNTVEMRLFYYPKTVESLEHYRFTITTSTRIRYPTSLVNKPSTFF